jgi:transcriptional/translational regulatory protein YebC/TACO1
VRHAFSKNGGNLGTDGSVAFLFRHCGQIVFAPGTDENRLIELALGRRRRGRRQPRRRLVGSDRRANDLVRVRQLLVVTRASNPISPVTMKLTVEVECWVEDAVRCRSCWTPSKCARRTTQDVYTTQSSSNEPDPETGATDIGY